MEVIDFDADTVTIRMRQREELAQLFGLVVSVGAQYSALDPYELEMTREQVRQLSDTLEQVLRQSMPATR